MGAGIATSGGRLGTSTPKKCHNLASHFLIRKGFTGLATAEAVRSLARLRQRLGVAQPAPVAPKTIRSGGPCGSLGTAGGAVKGSLNRSIRSSNSSDTFAAVPRLWDSLSEEGHYRGRAYISQTAGSRASTTMVHYGGDVLKQPLVRTFAYVKDIA
jgi:hypothetical protein